MLFLNTLMMKQKKHWNHRLTVTNVVFESEAGKLRPASAIRLTVTNVVFEFGAYEIATATYDRLTVTNVVFEFA